MAWIVVAGFDPAFQRDACAGAIARSNGERVEVCAVWERRPEKNAPLVPSVTVKEFGAFALRHGARALVSDIHYRETVREHLPPGLVFVDAPGGNSGKAAVYSAARELIHAGRVRWSAGHKRLTAQMREVIARPLPGGLIAITSPRRRGSHGDIASALCLTLWLLSQKPARPRMRPIGLPDYSSDDFTRPPLDENLLPPGLEYKR
jgi:hypothetical protein